MMGRFTGFLLASDFDDTLMPTTELSARSEALILPARNHTALSYFIAEGGIFTVSTGRSAATFAPFAQQIPMNAPAIVSGGAALYDYADQAFKEISHLPARSLTDLAFLAQQFPQAALEVYHEDETVYVLHPNEYSRTHQVLTHTVMEEVSAVSDISAPFHKALFEADHETLLALEQQMNATGLNAYYEMIFASAHMLELTEKGADKGSMLLKLAASLQIPPQNICAVGDHVNDLPMLRVAAHPFAPKNAVDAVRNLPGLQIVCAARDGALFDVISLMDQVLSAI